MSQLNTNMNPQGDMNLNLKISDTTEMTCDDCGHNVFVPGNLLRKVSALVSPTAQEAMVPIQVMVCHKCGHVNDDFKPTDLKEGKAKSK